MFLVFVFLLFRFCFVCFALFLFCCWIVFGVVLVFFLLFFVVCFLGFEGQVRWLKGPPHLALNPPYFLFVFLCVFLCFPFFASNRKSRFPLRKGILFFFLFLPFLLAFFWPPPFHFLFLCLSRVRLFLPSFLFLMSISGSYFSISFCLFSVSRCSLFFVFYPLVVLSCSESQYYIFLLCILFSCCFLFLLLWCFVIFVFWLPINKTSLKSGNSENPQMKNAEERTF